MTYQLYRDPDISRLRSVDPANRNVTELYLQKTKQQLGISTNMLEWYNQVKKDQDELEDIDDGIHHLKRYDTDSDYCSDFQDAELYVDRIIFYSKQYDLD